MLFQRTQTLLNIRPPTRRAIVTGTRCTFLPTRKLPAAGRAGASGHHKVAAVPCVSRNCTPSEPSGLLFALIMVGDAADKRLKMGYRTRAKVLDRVVESPRMEALLASSVPGRNKMLYRLLVLNILLQIFDGGGAD